MSKVIIAIKRVTSNSTMANRGYYHTNKVEEPNARLRWSCELDFDHPRRALRRLRAVTRTKSAGRNEARGCLRVARVIRFHARMIWRSRNLYELEDAFDESDRKLQKNTLNKCST
jgi:hypothetical protein